MHRREFVAETSSTVSALQLRCIPSVVCLIFTLCCSSAHSPLCDWCWLFHCLFSFSSLWL